MLLPGPDTRVVELRVHGVMGTQPETLVGAVAAVDVAGDGVGRIVRPADRLRRPAPGPMLPAEGRPLPRIVEGYVWGGMTSGGPAKALWALLFPFSLGNVAHWMLPPIPEGNRAAAVLGLLNRSLLRLAALLLTMLFVGQVAVVSLDLIAAQCLDPASACLAAVPDWLRELRGFRPAVGLLPVLLVVLVLHRVSTVTWDCQVAQSNAAGGDHGRQRLPGANLVADPDTPTLRALHTVASLAVVALLPLGGPFGRQTAGFETVLWSVALVLLLLTMLGVVLLDDPTGGSPRRAGRWLRAALGPVARRTLVGLGIALVIAAGVARQLLPAGLSGTDSTVEGVGALLVVVCVVFGLLLVPAALIARPIWAGQQRQLRPWAGGWMAAPMLVLACLLGAGYGAGFAITVRQLVGTSRMQLPEGYESITLLWGVGALLTVLVGVLALVGVLIRRWQMERAGICPPVTGLLHEGCSTKILATAGRAWRGAELQQRHTHHVLLAFAAVLSGGAAVSIWMRLRDVGTPPWLQPLSTVGVLALGVLAAGLLRTIYLAVKAPRTARYLGVLADLVCFWPREAHPTVPPCYAVKVVPELVARATEHLREPGNRVVLTGHSQGSLLVAVTAARLLASLPPEDAARVGIVTAGSQLQWAYPRAFPAVVPHSSLAQLHGDLAGRWRAMCRGTDPLGGAVTTWRRQVYDGKLLGVGLRPDGTTGPLSAATRAPNGALVLGGDHWLPDPQNGPLPGHRWSAGVLGHGDYTSDPEWDRAVAMAAGLDPAQPNGPAPSLPVPRRARGDEGTPPDAVPGTNGVS